MARSPEPATSRTVNRGAAAYQQAYEYVTAGSPRKSERQLRRLAMRYLRITASPPLTRQERRQALLERVRRSLANENRRS